MSLLIRGNPSHQVVLWSVSLAFPTYKLLTKIQEFTPLLIRWSHEEVLVPTLIASSAISVLGALFLLCKGTVQVNNTFWWDLYINDAFICELFVSLRRTTPSVPGWPTPPKKQSVPCFSVLGFFPTNIFHWQINCFFRTNISPWQINKVFCTTFLGKNPLLFWGAGGFPGHLSPPCDWQPCPSAWPLQVFSSPWFLMFRLVYVRIFRNTSLPLLNTSTFSFACDILHKVAFYRFLYRRQYCGEKDEEEMRMKVSASFSPRYCYFHMTILLNDEDHGESDDDLRHYWKSSS